MYVTNESSLQKSAASLRQLRTAAELSVQEWRTLCYFNSSVLTEACFRTNQVFAICICYYLSILQLASFNLHAAKATIANHRCSSQSEIISCTNIVPELLNQPELGIDPLARRQAWTKIENATAGNAVDDE